MAYSVNQKTRKLEHQKGFRIQVGKGNPRSQEGSDGELTLRTTKSGLKLFAKYKNRWFVVGDQSLGLLGGRDGDTSLTPHSMASGTTINSRTGDLDMGGAVIFGKVNTGAGQLGEAKTKLYSSGSGDLTLDPGKDFLVTLDPNNKVSISGGTLTVGTADDRVLELTATLNDTSDSGTHIFRLIKGNVTITDGTGWDNEYLMDLQVGGTSQISVDTAGNMVLVGDLAVNGDTITSDGSLEIDAGGAVSITGQDVAITTTKKIYLDGGGGGGDTFITEVLPDNIGISAGGDYIMTLAEYGADGNEALFKTSCATFSRQEATFSTTGAFAFGNLGGTDDTDIDFRHSNKYRLEMTGDITNMNLIFPKGSGNFLLLCTTNGDHDVTNWKVYEYDESAATTTDIMWAGGSVPAFTDTGVDIVSFYWDATEQQCYGVASLAFATP